MFRNCNWFQSVDTASTANYLMAVVGYVVYAQLGSLSNQKDFFISSMGNTEEGKHLSLIHI